MSHFLFYLLLKCNTGLLYALYIFITPILRGISPFITQIEHIYYSCNICGLKRVYLCNIGVVYIYYANIKRMLHKYLINITPILLK